MTENEAKAVRFIENIKSHAMATLDHIAREEPNVSPLVYKGREKKADTILKMIEELRQYRAIGTPEECRAAVEKQKEKNPIRIDKCTCPSCGTHNEVWKKRRNTLPSDVVHCWHCGQAVEIFREANDGKIN